MIFYFQTSSKTWRGYGLYYNWIETFFLISFQKLKLQGEKTRNPISHSNRIWGLVAWEPILYLYMYPDFLLENDNDNNNPSNACYRGSQFQTIFCGQNMNKKVWCVCSLISSFLIFTTRRYCRFLIEKNLIFFYCWM